jgi:hypothetical protein
LLTKIQKIAASLAKALSLNDYINKTLAGFPNQTIRCLIGGINLDPSLGIGGSLGSGLDGISKFSANINPKINFAAGKIQGVLGRQLQALNLATQSVCLLKTAITNMIGKLSPGSVGLLDCIVAGVNLKLPQCVLDSLNEVNLLLQSVNSSIDLALNVVANLQGLSSKMLTLKIETPTTQSPCSDKSVNKFLSKCGLSKTL